MSYANTVKLESKVLQFEFNYSQVQFNKNGKYFLRFTIHNHHREDLLPQVQLEQNNSKKKVSYREVVTDPVTWDGTDQSVSFNVNSLRYTFPKGFCKNDNNYDVTLTIEALATETAGRKFDQPTVVGEAKFAIYPRTDAPRANLLVDRGENYYKYSGIITLLRPFTKSSISMHCGRISYSVAFREDTDATDREDRELEETGAKMRVVGCQLGVQLLRDAIEQGTPLPKPVPKPLPKPRPSRARKKPVLPSKEPEPKNQDTEDQLTGSHHHKTRRKSTVDSLKSLREACTSSNQFSASSNQFSGPSSQFSALVPAASASNHRISQLAVVPLIPADQTTANGKIFTELQKFIVEKFGKEKLLELATAGVEESNLMRTSVSLPFVALSDRRESNTSNTSTISRSTAEDANRSRSIAHSSYEMEESATSSGWSGSTGSSASAVVPEAKHVIAQENLTERKPAVRKEQAEPAVSKDSAVAVFFTEADEDKADMEDEDDALCDLADMWTTTDESSFEEPVPKRVPEKAAEALKVPERIVRDFQVAEKDVEESKVPERVVRDFQVTEKDVNKPTVPQRVVKDFQVADKDVKELFKVPKRVVRDFQVAEKDVEESKVPERVVRDFQVAEKDVKESTVPERVVRDFQVAEKDVNKPTVPQRVVKDFQVAEKDVNEPKVPERAAEDFQVAEKDVKEPKVPARVVKDFQVTVNGIAKEIEVLKKDLKELKNDSKESLDVTEKKSNPLEEKKVVAAESKIPEVKIKQLSEVVRGSSLPTPKSKKMAPVSAKKTSLTTSDRYKLDKKMKENEVRSDISRSSKMSSIISRAISNRKNEKEAEFQDRMRLAGERTKDVKPIQVYKNLQVPSHDDYSLGSRTDSAGTMPKQRPLIQRSNRNNVREMKILRTASERQTPARPPKPQPPWDNRITRVWDAKTQSFTVMAPRQVSLPGNLAAGRKPETRKNAIEKMRTPSKLRKDEEVNAFLEKRMQHGKRFEVGGRRRSSATSMRYKPPRGYLLPANYIRSSSSSSLELEGWRGASNFDMGTRQQQNQELQDSWKGRGPKMKYIDPRNSFVKKPPAVEETKPAPEPRPVVRNRRASTDQQPPAKPEVTNVRQVKAAVGSRKVKRTKSNRKPSIADSDAKKVELANRKELVEEMEKGYVRGQLSQSAQMLSTNPHETRNENTEKDRQMPHKSYSSDQFSAVSQSQTSYLNNYDQRGAAPTRASANQAMSDILEHGLHLAASVSNLVLEATGRGGKTLKVIFSCMDGRVCPVSSQARIDREFVDMRRETQHLTDRGSTQLDSVRRHLATPEPFMPDPSPVRYSYMPEVSHQYHPHNQFPQQHPQQHHHPQQYHQHPQHQHHHHQHPQQHQVQPQQNHHPQQHHHHQMQQPQQLQLQYPYMPGTFGPRQYKYTNPLPLVPANSIVSVHYPLNQHRHNVYSMLDTVRLLPTNFSTESIGMFGVPNWQTFLNNEKKKGSHHLEQQVNPGFQQTSYTAAPPILPIQYHQPVTKQPKTETPYHQQKDNLNPSYHPEVFNYRPETENQRESPLPDKWVTAPAVNPELVVQQDAVVTKPKAASKPVAPKWNSSCKPDTSKTAIKQVVENRRKRIIKQTETRKSSKSGVSGSSHSTSSGSKDGEAAPKKKGKRKAKFVKKSGSSGSSTQLATMEETPQLTIIHNNNDDEVLEQLKDFHEKRKRFMAKITDAIQREESFFGKQFFKDVPALLPPPTTTPTTKSGRTKERHHHHRRHHTPEMEDMSTQVRERHHHGHKQKEQTPKLMPKQASLPIQASTDRGHFAVKGKNVELQRRETIPSSKPATVEKERKPLKAQPPRLTQKQQDILDCIAAINEANRQVEGEKAADTEDERPAPVAEKQAAAPVREEKEERVTTATSTTGRPKKKKHKPTAFITTAPSGSEESQESHLSDTPQQQQQQQETPVDTMNQFLARVSEPGLAEKIQEEVERSKKMLKKYDQKEQKQMLREIIMSYLPVDPDMSTQTSQYSIAPQQQEEEPHHEERQQQQFLSKKQLKTLAEVVEVFREQKANHFPVFTTRGVEWSEGSSYLNCYASKRPTPFEGRFDPISRRYDPVLMSNNYSNGSGSRRNSNASSGRRTSVASDGGMSSFGHSRRSSLASDGGMSSFGNSRRSSLASDGGMSLFGRGVGSVKETSLRKAVLNKNRRTSMLSKEELEEKKVKELLYIRMKEKMLEYKNEENKMRKVLPRQLLPEVFAASVDDGVRPTRRAERLSAAERNPILGVGLPQRRAEHMMMMQPIFDKAIQKTRDDKKGKRKFTARPTTIMQPSAGTICYEECEPKRRKVKLKESVETWERRMFLYLTDYRKRQRDRLRNVNTKPVTPPPPTPPPPVKEVRSIEVQTSSPIPSATGSDRYYANGINGDLSLLEPFSKDQATSTTEDRLNEDVHISISSRDNITSPPQDHQVYKRTRDSPTGYPNNSRIPTLNSFSSAPNAQGIQPPPPPSQQPQPSNQTTARQKKKKTYQAPPPRKIVRKNKTNENSRNGTQTSNMKSSNNSITPIRHVSKPGYEDIYVAIHGATSLPSCGDGTDPTPFASLKTGTEDRNDVKAVCTTHASYQPTHSPTWEEAFTLQIPEGSVSNEDIVLAVNDSSTKDQLISYKIPIDYLEPFHTYHLELVQPTPAIPHGIRMYVTIQRKMSHLQRKQEFGYCALEVTLRDFQHELKNSPGSLLAVTRIVPDYTGYKDLMLTRRPFAAGINPQIINFPSPGRHHFIRSSENSQGYPQLSLPSTADRQPDWGHTFLFSHNEAATMFSRRAAVVVEYYPASNMITPVTWAVKSPVGYSVIHLDEDTLQALTSDPGRLGIRIDDVLVQESNYETQEGPYPSVRLVLRLISTERPDTMVAAGNVEMLPQLDTLVPTSNLQFTPTPQMVADEYFQPRTPTPLSLPPTPLSIDNTDEQLANLTAFGGDTTRNQQQNKLLVKEDEFPPDDAIENILPEYSLTPNDLQLYNIPTNSTIPIPRPSEARIQQRQQQPRNLPKQPSNLTTTTDRNMASVIDQREKELNRYKDAVKRMSHDIVNLRQENLSLKSNNQVLRRDVNESKDNAAALLSYRSNIPNQQSQYVDPSLVDSAELAQELDEVNQKLAKDSLDLQKYKSKVQHLQNQVIKANEREKNYLSDQMTRKQLQDAITDLNKKVRKTHKLEETVLKQESVILKMEDLLKKTQKEAAESKAAAAKPPPKLPANEDVLASLTSQNNRLHNDMQKQKETSDAELKDLRARLERAENRASSLEQQLVRNAREWAREKQDLTVRLQEHRNGIIRKNTNA